MNGSSGASHALCLVQILTAVCPLQIQIFGSCTLCSANCVSNFFFYILWKTKKNKFSLSSADSTKMLILIANIGGAAAYNNLLDELYEINRSGYLPDICFIQKCGNDRNFPGLQPYFNSYITNENIRIHTSTECPETTIKTVPDSSIIIATLNISSRRGPKEIQLIFGYRESATTKQNFISKMDKILSETPQGMATWIGGDFNITRNDPLIENLMITVSFLGNDLQKSLNFKPRTNLSIKINTILRS